MRDENKNMLFIINDRYDVLVKNIWVYIYYSFNI